MADDIVTRLRAGSWCGVDHCTDIENEAADEIDRLRAAGDELAAALTPQFVHIIPDEVEHAAHWEHREFALRAWEEARRG